jgi:hypothetical protein
LDIWNIKGSIETYVKDVTVDTKSDQLYKNSKKKEIVKSMLTFANNFDPSGITGIIAAFIHDDCP